MDDLISRKAAIDYLMTNMNWHDEDGYTVDDADDKHAIITDLINGIPAVDAVPVIRCKDCKHFETYKGCHGRCNRHSTLALNGKFYSHTHWTNEDDYCSSGERREQDG